MSKAEQLVTDMVRTLPIAYMDNVQHVNFTVARQAVVDAIDGKTCERVYHRPSDGWVCSLCRYHITYKDNYCAGCGARIVGDSDEARFTI